MASCTAPRPPSVRPHVPGGRSLGNSTGCSCCSCCWCTMPPCAGTWAWHPPACRRRRHCRRRRPRCVGWQGQQHGGPCAGGSKRACGTPILQYLKVALLDQTQLASLAQMLNVAAASASRAASMVMVFLPNALSVGALLTSHPSHVLRSLCEASSTVAAPASGPVVVLKRGSAAARGGPPRLYPAAGRSTSNERQPRLATPQSQTLQPCWARGP